FQYTPVDSIATMGTCRPSSQSSKSSRSGVVVPNVRTSVCTRSRSSSQRTQTTTVSLCTSRPAQMRCRVSIEASATDPQRQAAQTRSSLLCVFTHEGDNKLGVGELPGPDL